MIAYPYPLFRKGIFLHLLQHRNILLTRICQTKNIPPPYLQGKFHSITVSSHHFSHLSGLPGSMSKTEIEDEMPEASKKLSEQFTPEVFGEGREDWGFPLLWFCWWKLVQNSLVDFSWYQVDTPQMSEISYENDIFDTVKVMGPGATERDTKIESFDDTIPETNIAPDKRGLGDYTFFGKPIFRHYVSFREGITVSPVSLHSFSRLRFLVNVLWLRT